MSNRVTIKDLEAIVKRINIITNSPLESYTAIENKDGTRKLQSNIGNYHLSWAYGGVCLHRMHNDAGGVTTPLNSGHVSKKELQKLLFAYIAGLVKYDKN